MTKLVMEPPSQCYIMGPSMCKFPYSILIVYYSNLILYSVILLYIIEYYRYITNDVMSSIYT